ncbi:hypothetical protein CUN59_16580 [Cuspidothrix issatschenkoi CHARLIE-1]|uniref:Uncharacterized protein n=1 Tax=Cuspidothrix issatschenkoi CHARLIE-1 TaxID=2052836 RepID=A0A2S6CRA3_9CYAN|nr:hypothetical protein CUN59_16580 [Cuspidothrix issatschenkoi CHARLIE-1]
MQQERTTYLEAGKQGSREVGRQGGRGAGEHGRNFLILSELLPVVTERLAASKVEGSRSIASCLLPLPYEF